MRVKIFYLSYDGLLDPLGRSQVVPYLLKLSSSSIRLTVLSFEKPQPAQAVQQLRDRLTASGIRWICLRYHLRPPILSTAWDIFAGLCAATAHVFKDKPDIVHARSYVVAGIAIWLKAITGARFLFDIRGFWPDEKVEGGFWIKDGWLYRMTKVLEKRFFRASDAVVSLSDKGRQILKKQFQSWGIERPIIVIPTCVDTDRFTPAPALTHSRTHTPRHLTLAYIGSVGSFYMLDAMRDFFNLFRQRVPDARWLILTNRPDPSIEKTLNGLPEGTCEIRILQHEQVPEALAQVDATLCFIKPVFSKLACCPTKVGESLSCGIPVVITQGAGDCDGLAARERVGVVLTAFDQKGYEAAGEALLLLLADGEILAQRCRKTAKAYFDLDQGVRQYTLLYQSLMNKCQPKNDPATLQTRIL